MDGRARLRTALGIGLFAAILFAAVALGPERVIEVLLGLEGSPWLVPLLLGLYLLRPFIGWPHSPFPAAAGFYFGFLGGSLIAFVGLVLTCLPPFAVGRYLSEDEGALERLGAFGERFTDAAGEARSVASARLLPIPADLVSYGAGVAGVSTRAFTLGTLLGDLPWLLGLVYVGTQLEALTTEGVDALPVEAIALLALIALALVGKPLYVRLRG